MLNCKEKKTVNDYLQKITWKKEDISPFVFGYLKNMRIIVLLAVALMIAGFASYKTLPQTVAPEINITIMVVSAALPGATPEDVEQLLTIPLEEELGAIDGIDQVTATAGEGFTSIVMTFVRGVDKNRAQSDVESALGRVSELPEDATEPRVEAVDFEDAPVVQWTFAYSSDAATSLSAKMQKLADELETNRQIDRVVTGGLATQEVQILIAPESFESYGLSIAQIRQAVTTGIMALPSGKVRGQDVERSITIGANVESVDDLREVPIILETGEIITLGDVATIVERPEPGASRAFFHDGSSAQQAVTLDVYRSDGVDISNAVASAVETAEKFLENDGDGLTRYEVYNADKELSDQFNDLMRNLATTVVLVFITLTLFVGRRQAFLAALSIPLIYAVAFVAMQITGISVNFLSLFSLMLSLGLLVDVTIVIVSAMTTYMREGNFTPHQTGGLVFRDFFFTLVMTTLTTVWAFVPLLLAGGIIGEYIKPIPVVVSSVLLASVLVGFFIILPLMIWLFDFSLSRRVRVFLYILGFIALTMIAAGALQLQIPLAIVVALGISLVLISTKSLIAKTEFSQKRKKEKMGDRKHASSAKDVPRTVIDLTHLQARYRSVLEKVIATSGARWKTIAMVVTFFIFASGLVGFGFVKSEFFPGDDNDILYVALELPSGMTAEKTQAATIEVLSQLQAIDGVDYVTMQGGFTSNGEGSSQASDNNVLFTLKTPYKADGGRGSQSVARDLRDAPVITDFDAGKATVVEVAGGPPAGADITITFIGTRLETLRSLAQELEEKVQGFTIENIAISPGEAAAIVSYQPDLYLLSREGVAQSQISEILRLTTTGITIADNVEFTGLEDKRDVVMRATSQGAMIDEIGKLSVQGESGRIPIDVLGKSILTRNITEIERVDFERTVTLTAAVKPGGNAAQINAEIAEVIDSEMDLPSGYTWKTGGANEENNESVAAIIQGMGLAAALIFLTLIIHLRSYRKAAIVLMTIPLGISGVFIMFGIFGIPLSFPSLIGILALFGIVVNNAIIIISQINANRDVGLSFKESVLSGASSRLEPILLSSLTTIIGLMPITISDPIWRGLGGAIIAGLSFSGIIMLFFIPTLYYTMMSDEDPERIA